jgi:hypothetical protein
MEGSDILVDRIIRGAHSMLSVPLQWVTETKSVTMQTGLATSLCAIIDLILFLTDPIALRVAFFLLSEICV